MPIFSNRSIARMLGDIEPVIGRTRAHDLRRRLQKGGEGAIAAEWEIAVIHCLGQVGKIRANRSRDGVSDVDLIYTSHSLPGKVAVEITAISDESLHERNPVYAFNDEILRLTLKNQIHRHGGIHTHIGDVKGAQGLILGVPLRKNFTTFFGSPEIREFFEQISASPRERHEYRFTARGAASALVYEPGRATGGGGHLSHTVLVDPTRNPIITRLKAKDRQIRNSKLELPAVVILCDANCRALSTQLHTSGTVKVEDVVDLFLAGRPHIEQGPWTIQKGESPRSSRINAVALWSLHEAWNTHARGPEARKTRVHVIPNRGHTYHTLHQDLVLEIAGAARHLPPIVRMPLNALRTYRRPAFYGGWSMSDGGNHVLKIKLSLLGFQQILSGEIEFTKFAADHSEAFQSIKRVTADGAMLSDVRIEHVPDRDDDWIEFVFDRVAPSRLFESRPEEAWWKSLLKKPRGTFRR
jgi:hypothetical protein